MKRQLARVVFLISFTGLAVITFNLSSVFAIGSTPEAKNMRLVGLTTCRRVRHISQSFTNKAIAGSLTSVITGGLL
jgi:hypothetical protein